MAYKKAASLDKREVTEAGAEAAKCLSPEPKKIKNVIVTFYLAESNILMITLTLWLVTS
ncbi:hypothetical protein EDE15_2664 [Edaphobacter aggregans]|uniref:Uncharacterized protein n=1 Tax=Edaphobacter aggregans TaxID=570835 RepID=A0A428MJU1_9BACT|nr:hypothetical protein [Edaphobacter aggregans]RSL17136.1 hypothetical protein EDE15_2664 [Edaphobacter aggregans]